MAVDRNIGSQRFRSKRCDVKERQCKTGKSHLTGRLHLIRFLRARGYLAASHCLATANLRVVDKNVLE